MIDNKEDALKNYSLRDYQVPVFQSLLEAGNRMILKAPPDWGKTYAACRYVNEKITGKDIRTVTFSIPNYEMRRKVLDDLRITGILDQMVVVCPEGRDRAYVRKKKRSNSLHLDKAMLRGKVIDLDYVKKEWPQYNPYRILLWIQKHIADITVVQHSMLETNKALKKSDLLIVDDGDTMTRTRTFLLWKYETFEGKHLQAMKDATTDLKEIKVKIEPKKDRVILLSSMLDELWNTMPENPEKIETWLVMENNLRSEKLENSELWKTIWNITMKGKTEQERLRKLINQRSIDVGIALSQAANPVKINSILENLKATLSIYLEGLDENVEREISYAFHWDHRIEPFFKALLNPDFYVKESRTDSKWSTLEVFLTRRSTFMEVVNAHSRVLWISATVNLNSDGFKDYKVIEDKHDPHAEHKKVISISREMIPEILLSLKDRNTFVVTNSGEGALTFREKHGGDILTKDSFESVVARAKRTKGNLVISYVNGIASRGLDILYNLFDAIIVDSWIYRSVQAVDGKFYHEQHENHNLADVQQIVGRIMRGANNHVLFVIGDDEKIVNHITEANPSWEFMKDNSIEDISGMVDAFVPERKEQEMGKLRLYRTVHKLKNGEKELIYSAKATDDQINNSKDFIELD